MTSLLDQVITMQNLHSAWNAIDANKGMPGIDDISVRAWRRNWEERLQELIHLVRTNTYKPRKLRLKKIPKKNGAEFRTLRVPTITDRIFQRAVLQTLHPIFERRFLDCSFGYRPNHSLAHAVQRVIVLRENDYRWILDADIEAFFDNVNHEILLDFLEHDLPDKSLLPLIKHWLAVGCANPQERVGIPLGSPLSPLWANVFLHRLDQALAERGRPLVRYADDFIVFAETPSEAEKARAEAQEILSSLRLKYKQSKTRLTSFEEGFDFVGVHFEGGEYSYTYMDKRIEVTGDEVDWLFLRFGPGYE